MKVVKYLLLLAGMFYLESTIYTSMRRLTQRATIPVGRAIGAGLATNQSQQFSQSNLVKNEIEKSSELLPIVAPSQLATEVQLPASQAKAILDSQLVQTHEKIIAQLLTLTEEQQNMVVKMFKNYIEIFKLYIDNPLNKKIAQYVQRYHTGLQQLMENFPEIWQKFQDIHKIHQEIMSWRNNLTIEQQEFFQNLFKKYDEEFGWYIQDPTIPSITSLVQTTQSKLQALMALMKRTAFNPITFYFEVLNWKKQQSAQMLQTIEESLEMFTKAFKALIDEVQSTPLSESAVKRLAIFYLTGYLVNNTVISYQLMISSKKPFEHQILAKKRAREFYDSFNNWKKEQSVETLQIYDPIIHLYEEMYLKYMKKYFWFGSFEMQSLQVLLNEIMHSDTASINFKSVFKDINTVHHELMQVTACFSADQQKLLEPIMKDYLKSYKDYQKEPTDMIHVIEKQINIAELMKKNLNILKPVPGYTTVNCQRVENLDGFFNAVTQLKPELVALQHFQDTQAHSGPYVPLCSLDTYLKEGVLAHADSEKMLITVGQLFHELSPAKQYHTLLHEYRHHLQHINYVTCDELVSVSAKNPAIKTTEQNDELLIARAQKFYPAYVLKEAERHKGNLTWRSAAIIVWKPYEYDAEYFATEHVTCPTCLKIIQSDKSQGASLEGYFNPDNFEPFIQAAQNNPCCPAHTKTPGDDDHNHIIVELETALQQYKTDPSFTLKAKIARLDKKSGTLLQHIRNFNQDLIRSMEQDKELLATFGAKTLKAIDVRQQARQAEQDIQAGRYKLLEAPKPLVSKLHHLGNVHA